MHEPAQGIKYMENLRELLSSDASLVLAIGGLAIGFFFGALISRTNYCAMGALADIHNFGDTRRLRAWVLAAAVAIAGTQMLALAGVVDTSKAMYAGASFNWLGHVVGGLVFGVGMVFAGGCPSRNLARAGSGDLRSLVTLIVLGLFAYMTIGGILAPARTSLESLTTVSLNAPTQRLGDLLASRLPLGPVTLASLVSLALVAAGIGYAFAGPAFRKSPLHVLSGLGVGLCVVAGWALTGLTYDELASKPVSPVSLTFVRPSGDSLEWLQRYTASPLPGFGVASLFGALLGSFAVSFSRGHFRLSTFTDVGDTLRHLGGAILMGLGGVMAMGCTVGQSLTGVSTLSLGSFVATAAIVVGGRYGLVALERRILATA